MVSTPPRSRPQNVLIMHINSDNQRYRVDIDRERERERVQQKGIWHTEVAMLNENN